MKKGHKVSFLIGLVVSLFGAMLLPSRSEARYKRTCWTVPVYITTCVYSNGELLGCTTYFDQYIQYCEWDFGGDDGGGGGGGGGGNGGGGGGPRDTDGNHRIDTWHEIVVTNDPCAYQLDEGDQLGTDFGGSNAARPHHNGVDIQCNHDDPVYSIGSGTVVGVGGDPQSGPGYYIIVNHDDGTQAQYFHLDQQIVSVGQHIQAGQLIALADSTGNSTGDHLHLMMKDAPGGTVIDPLSYADVPPTQAELNGGC